MMQIYNVIIRYANILVIFFDELLKNYLHEVNNACEICLYCENNFTFVGWEDMDKSGDF